MIGHLKKEEDTFDTFSQNVKKLYILGLIFSKSQYFAKYAKMKMPESLHVSQITK